MRSAKRFFSGTLLSRFSGLLRDVSMAAAFGTHEAVAAFFVAFRLAHLLRRLFGEGALQSAFVPQFETLRSQNSQRAYQFFCDLAGLLTLGLSGLILLVMAGLGGVMLWGGLTPGNQELIWLTLLLMPSLLFICLYGLNASLLQCEKSYFTAGVAPVAFNLIWVLGVFFLRNLPVEEAIAWLTCWVVAACFFQWFITVPRVYSLMRQHTLGILWQGWHFITSDIRRLGTLLFLGIVGVAASQINNALDVLFARYADPEGPALLWYALRIQQLPLALFGIAISGALLPPLTRAMKNGDHLRFQGFLEFALRRTVALMLPITAALFVMGDSCVNLLYGHGDFHLQSVAGTTQCLWGYSIGLLPMSLVLILAPEFYARGEAHIPALMSVISMSVNIFLNSLMVAFLGLGAASIALATSISACVNCVLLGYWSKELDQVLSSSVWRSMSKVFLSAMAAMIMVFVMDTYWLQGSSAWKILQGEGFVVSREMLPQLTRFLLQGTCFCGTLIVVGKLLQAQDLLQFFFTPEVREEEAK